MSDTSDRSLRWYFAQEPMIVLVLAAIAAVLFVAVAGLSKLFHTQRAAIGNRAYLQGVADMDAGRLGRAVDQLSTALFYSPDNFGYQLRLAQALSGLHRTNEAYSYLVNLWQREPDNGTVNLELARTAASHGDINQALRYYQNALYAVWENDADKQRRTVRLELIRYLLGANAKAQAQSELIALAANLPDDPSLHLRVAELFAQANDHEHAFTEYRQALRDDRRNATAAAGAGREAFQLGRYPQAQRFLKEAILFDHKETDSQALLETTDLVLQLNPFGPQVHAHRRNQIVVDAFETAGKQLKTCAATRAPGISSRPLDDLNRRWAEMRPSVNMKGLSANPDMANETMDLVFSIEQQASDVCGKPEGKDLALLLISHLREEN